MTRTPGDWPDRMDAAILPSSGAAPLDSLAGTLEMLEMKAESPGIPWRCHVAGTGWFGRIWGPPEGTPILLLHGFTWDSSLWEGLAVALGPDFRAIAVDLPGHGGTGWPPRARFSDIAAVIPSLLPDTRPILTGYSLGARVALAAALAAPDAFAGLVIVSGSAGISDDADRLRRAAEDDALAADIRREGIERFVERWERHPLFESQRRLPAEVRATLRSVRLAQDPEGLARSLEILGQGRMPPLWSDLGRVRLPTAIVAGADDSRYATIARRLGAAIRGASLTLVPACGHAVPLEAPDALADVIVRLAATATDPLG